MTLSEVESYLEEDLRNRRDGGEDCPSPDCEAGQVFEVIGDGYAYKRCPDCNGTGKNPAEYSAPVEEETHEQL